MKCVLLTFLTAVAMLLPACGSQEAFRTVQMCVSNERGLKELQSSMRSAADAEHLQFIDNSAQVASDLQQTAQSDAGRREAVGAIDVHMEGEGGLGVTATNLGLPRYEVGLGFTEGSNADKAHRLADRLLNALSQHFTVTDVPLGKGLMRMNGCSG